MILRPPEYLEDVRERELEMQAAEARLRAARPGAVPALRLPHRARLRALPELPAQAQGALRQLLAPARPGVDDLPLLRGRRARARRAARRAAGAARPSRQRAVADARARRCAAEEAERRAGAAMATPATAPPTRRAERRAERRGGRTPSRVGSRAGAPRRPRPAPVAPRPTPTSRHPGAQRNPWTER